MKHWNKQKKVREQYWTRIYFPESIFYYQVEGIKLALQRNPSKNKFYITHNYVEFEHAKDATWFTLTQRIS